MSKGNRIHTLWRLIRYLMHYKFWLILALILTIGSNLFALIGPMLSGYAIDAMSHGQGQVDFRTVYVYSGWMLAFYLGSAVLSYVLSALMIRVSKAIMYQMRKDIFEHLLRLPVSYFDTHQSGDLISRISYDVDTLNTSLSSDFIQLVTLVVTVTGALGMMCVISPKLLLVFCITVPLSFWRTKKITNKTRPLFKKRSIKLGELNSFVEEMIGGQKALKAYTREPDIIKLCHLKNEAAVQAYYEADYYASTVGPCVNFINNLSLALISLFGALLYLAGQMTIGNISSFILYSRKFSGPINEAANIISELQSALAAAERIFNLLDEVPEAADLPSAHVLEKVVGHVELSHVTFGYHKDVPIIKDLSLDIAPGQMVAIVGPTGAGKTTLINLLMRFYDINSGQIRIDGKLVEKLTRRSLRQSFAMVLQETWLFQGSIYDNLLYGRPDATRAEVIAAAKAAKIHHYIMSLPNGYETVLSDDSTNISKGQKQLLTIARAMLMDAPMLILDEATSNVDTRTELAIQEAMQKLMKNRTCFVIAHRLSTIQNADLILVVKDGEIIEQGSHHKLMAHRGFYYELYEAQFA